MGNETSTPPLAEEQGREIINRWGDGGFFRLRNMGDKIFVGQIKPGAAYTIRLQTHYERRQVVRVSEPYQGQQVDDRGRPPDPWQIPVRLPGEFQETTQTVTIPHTDRVQMCGQCAGQGRVTCPRCLGQGRMACPWCHGSGVIHHQVMDSGRDPQGNPVPVARTVTRPCGTCSSGSVACSSCSGGGVQRCPQCAGTGQVKTFDQLVVRFQTAKQGELLDVTPVPDAWLGKMSGEMLVDQKERRIEACRGEIPAEVAQKASDLLTQSHAVDEERSRILLQMLHVERIPLYEIAYTYAGTDRKLWICGREQALYAPKAPWNRARLFGMIAGSVAALALIAGAMWWFLKP